MLKRKNRQFHIDDTKPVIDGRLEKRAFGLQTRCFAEVRGFLLLIISAVVGWYLLAAGNPLSPESTGLLAQAPPTALPAQPTVARSTGLQIAIDFPLPNQVVTDSIEIVGTVISPDLRHYFVEFRPLSNQNKNQWFLATLPRIKQKINGLLGTWNTTTIRDGIYELRLNVNAGSGPTQQFEFGTVEVRNTPKVPTAVAKSTSVNTTPTGRLAQAPSTASPAQPTAAGPTELQVAIDFPFPDQVVSYSIDIVGTVNTPDLLSYYVEFRALDNQWYPATLPRTVQKVDEVLGTWNVWTLRDGMYDLRVTVNVGSGQTQRIHFGPVEVRNNFEATAAAANITFVEAAPDALRKSPEFVCTERRVYLRTGPGQSDYEIAGISEPGQSYELLHEVEGESVRGNTKWLLVKNGFTRSYVSAHVIYPCRRIDGTEVPAPVSEEQATETYIASCEDIDLLHTARSSNEFGRTEVRRATAFCISKSIVVNLTASDALVTIEEAKQEIYALLCALRRRGYGIAFEVAGKFLDVYGHEVTIRAVLAIFEAKSTHRINCDSHHGAINWEYVADSWWAHPGLAD